MSTTIKISAEARKAALSLNHGRTENIHDISERNYCNAEIIQEAINAATATQQAECNRLKATNELLSAERTTAIVGLNNGLDRQHEAFCIAAVTERDLLRRRVSELEEELKSDFTTRVSNQINAAIEDNAAHPIPKAEANRLLMVAVKLIAPQMADWGAGKSISKQRTRRLIEALETFVYRVRAAQSSPSPERSGDAK